ncbi:hypothetical protein PUNSTDRAFT_143307 [Punctularia strigosozonata HHB-11173 SS5]|uniref:uncharacterized protein n=1 Tax=Punctularia strigosozonata (strain HHB-11173) TaxID=741275 RepID=UPI000441807F|nr:uncharacterized protein PUNSTDRAFT_143307 [Punctularia strigosozonata HHB-11173 SS5]EIN09913.1 hypothetical protein PUNSTDRAFT_143307 [Punctularia strigosozonata HHB-11173 SS5]
MSPPTAETFIKKQLIIEKNIVTFRSLSRALAVHVNQAKNELGAYHCAATARGDKSSSATYMLVGERRLTRQDYADVDEEDDQMRDLEEVEDEEHIMETTVLLVPEADLAESKKKLSRVLSVHIYCLSPSPIHDAALICEPTPLVRKTDVEKAADPGFASTVGRIVGQDVKLQGKAPLATRDMKGKTKAIADAAKAAIPIQPVPKPEPAPAQEANLPKAEDAKASRPEPEAPKKTDIRPKPTGKLDFSKAKTKKDKEREKEEQAKIKAEKHEAGAEVAKKKEVASKKEVSEQNSKKAEDEKKAGQTKTKSVEKRGTKRKSTNALMSDDEASESGSGSANAKSTASSAVPSRASSSRPEVKVGPPTRATTTKTVKRGIILSDDEDEEQVVAKKSAKGKAKATVLESDEESSKSARAMWDMDDDEVERVTHSKATSPAASPEPGDDTDRMDVDDDVEPVPKKPRKKKEQKVWPVGSNGLRKKRTVKRKMTVDDKGYTVFEDVSEYESVDEEDEEGQSAEGPAAVPTKPATSKEPPAAKDAKKKVLKPSGGTGGGAKKAIKSDGKKANAKATLAGFFNPTKK